jgi:osmotically-inducible protein OsmY
MPRDQQYDYRYTRDDEGDSSVRAGSYDQGRKEYAGYGVFGQGDYNHRADHRGKGPKGYERSDQRTQEMLCERLRDHPDIDASEVSITVDGSRVTLEGTVDSRHTKDLIEDVAEHLGVRDVQNNLRVERSGGRSINSERS